MDISLRAHGMDLDLPTLDTLGWFLPQEDTRRSEALTKIKK